MATHTVHIEPKKRDVSSAADTLRRVLQDAKRVEITAADAATLSGLPLDQCEPALLSLSARYPARLRVTKEGNLLFHFDSLEHPRGPGALTLLWRRLRHFLWRSYDLLLGLFTLLVVPPFCLAGALHLFVFGQAMNNASETLGILSILLLALPWLGLFLTGFLGFCFFQFFPLIALAIFLSGAAMLLGIPVGWVLWLFFPKTGPEISAQNLLFGNLGMALFGALASYYGWKLLKICYETGAAIIKGEKRSVARTFWRQAGGFLFGPPPAPPADALADERRLAAFIREKKGILCLADLIALFGWDKRTAESELTRILVDYGGDVTVTEEGAILYRFDPMMVSAGKTTTKEDTRPVYERETAPDPRFFGSWPYLSIAIFLTLAMGFLGLAFSPYLPAGASHLDALFPRDQVGFTLLLGRGYAAWEAALVLVFFSGYPYLAIFGVLLLRLPFYEVARHRARKQRRHLTLLRAALTQPEGAPYEGFSLSQAAGLGGELISDQKGAPKIAFPEIALSLRAAEHARKNAPDAASSEIVFDSGASVE